MARSFSLIAAFALCLCPLLGRDRGRIEVSPTDTPPVIDGILDDAAWDGAARIEDFLQREPATGAPATERTLALVTFDARNLYIGFRCFDSRPEAITAKEMARDADLAQDDRVQIILDTFLDRRTGYWFQIGPRGSIGDALVGDNGAVFNKEWDGLWQGRARIHEGGWDAEVAIPFQTLAFPKGSTTWGLKLIRHVKRLEEVAYWPVANLNTYRFQVSDAGTMEGLEGIDQGLGLDVRPYAVGGFLREAEGNRALVGDVGLDLFYRLGPALQSAVTVNTDFAETEVDARQTNLTRFPLFFPEKRDFFLDGASYFTFGNNRRDLLPFFSRRLGLDGAGRPMPILGGVKLTGQQGPWNLGLLSLAEDRPNEGHRGYGVARVRRNVGRESSAGVILTAGNALGPEGNTLAGADLRLATSRFRGGKNLAFTLYGLRSDTEGPVGADTAYGAEITYPNDLLEAEAGFREIGDRFRPGIGFVPRDGIRNAYLGLALQPRPERWGVRQTSFGGALDYVTDLEGRLLTRVVQLRPVAVRMDSGDGFGTGVVFSHEVLDEEFRIRPGYSIPADEYSFVSYLVEAETARRRNLWVASRLGWGGFFNGRRRTVEAAVGYKVAIPLYVSAEYLHNRVFLPSGSFSANVSRLQLNVLFSPDVTLYNYMQYDNFSRLLGWQSRFYWILRPGNEIILVWNANVREPWEEARWGETAARVKVNYNFRF